MRDRRKTPAVNGAPPPQEVLGRLPIGHGTNTQEFDAALELPPDDGSFVA